MNATNDTLGFGERLTEAMDDAGLPKHGRGVQVADWVGVSKPTAHAYINGKHLPLPDKARMLARKLNVEFDWLYSGILPKRKSELRVAEPPTPYLHGHVFPIVPWDGDSATVPAGHSMVRYLNARPSAGHGNALPDYVDDSRSLVFSNAWLREKHVAPENALVTKVVGESMAPFICNGDVVLFDAGKTKPRDNHIFVVCYFDELLIKRLFLDPDGSIRLHSDNRSDARFSKEIVIPQGHAENFRVMGEFVWRGG